MKISNRAQMLFYTPPVKIPTDPSHVIDFLDKTDNYNPFSTANKIASTSISLSKEIVELVVSDLVSIDIGLCNPNLLNAYSSKKLKNNILSIVRSLLLKRKLKMTDHYQMLFRLDVMQRKDICVVMLGNCYSTANHPILEDGSKFFNFIQVPTQISISHMFDCREGHVRYVNHLFSKKEKVKQ